MKALIISLLLTVFAFASFSKETRPTQEYSVNCPQCGVRQTLVPKKDSITGYESSGILHTIETHFLEFKCGNKECKKDFTSYVNKCVRKANAVPVPEPKKKK